jgi:Icc-related predicted phosphoesterase
MTRVLALADEVNESLYGPQVRSLRPDLVVACGDLPFDYLEYIVTMTNVPLLYVPGNHDPDLSKRPSSPDHPPIMSAPIADLLVDPPGPKGCINVDGALCDAAGITVAGLGGSIRYSSGPNQYTQGEMTRRALRLEWKHARRRLRGRPGIRILLTHSPPLGVGDGRDPAHQGFKAFHRLMDKVGPSVLIHGHVHPYGTPWGDHSVGATRVVNAVAYKMLEV